MASEQEIFPLDTVVRLKKTGELAIIRMHTLLKDEFLHYLGVIEGRGDGLWAVVYNNIELECLPKDVGHCCGTEF
jgi:hypothetical protein